MSEGNAGSRAGGWGGSSEARQRGTRVRGWEEGGMERKEIWGWRG